MCNSIWKRAGWDHATKNYLWVVLLYVALRSKVLMRAFVWNWKNIFWTFFMIFFVHSEFLKKKSEKWNEMTSSSVQKGRVGTILFDQSWWDRSKHVKFIYISKMFSNHNLRSNFVDLLACRDIYTLYQHQ